MIDATARGQGYFKVYADDAFVSQHTQEREALERSAEILAVRPTARVYYVHEYTVDVVLSDAPPPELPPEPEPYVTPAPDAPAVDLLDMIESALPETPEVEYQSANPDAAVGEHARRYRGDLLVHQLKINGSWVASSWAGLVLSWKDFRFRLFAKEQ